MEIPVKAVGVVTVLLDGRREIWIRIPAKACDICLLHGVLNGCRPAGHRYKATRP